MKSWGEIERSSNAEILAWAERQPWAQAMALCAQDALWHAEGDVWTHTRMVAGELEELESWPDFDSPSQLALLFTALFRDAGKPATTLIDPESGRTRSPKHALVGMELARSVLRSIGCDLTTREVIANLVRYHGQAPSQSTLDGILGFDPERERTRGVAEDVTGCPGRDDAHVRFLIGFHLDLEREQCSDEREETDGGDPESDGREATGRMVWDGNAES